MNFEEFEKAIQNKYEGFELFPQYYIDIEEYTKFNCPTHGLKKQVAKDLLENGCNQCHKCIHSKDNCYLCKGNFKTFDEYLVLAEQVWGDRYTYKDQGPDIDAHCNRHSYFRVNKYDHLKGSSCPKCSIIHNKRLLVALQDKFGFKLDYSKIEYINEYTKIKLRNTDGWFEEAPYILLPEGY